MQMSLRLRRKVVTRWGSMIRNYVRRHLKAAATYYPGKLSRIELVKRKEVTDFFFFNLCEYTLISFLNEQTPDSIILF